MKTTICYTFCAIFLCLVPPLFGQDMKVSVVLGDKTLPANKSFSITVNIQNSEQRDVRNFPEIPGFKKAGQEASTATSTIGGKVVVSHQIIQKYLPEQVGKFTLRPFSLMVNRQATLADGAVLTVTPPERNSLPSNSESDLDDFFAETEDGLQTTEDAFLTLRVNTSKVFVGQGFTVKVALLVAETNATEMSFPPDLAAQVAVMTRQIQPPNCLIENFGIEEVQRLPVDINGKKYAEYKVYQAVYYPLNNQPISFPSVSLRMQLGGTTRPDAKTFTSKPFSIIPVELPPHPLRNKVPVGVFSLQERSSLLQVGTGQSFTYEAHIVGEGNFGLLSAPALDNDPLFDFYPPEYRQSLNRRMGRVMGDKTFVFKVIPKQAGIFGLNKYFNWVFFNTNTARYDTLRSQLSIRVSGQKIVSKDTELNDEKSIYDDLELLDSTQPFVDYREIVKGFSNLLLAIMLLGMIYIFWRPKAK